MPKKTLNKLANILMFFALLGIAGMLFMMFILMIILVFKSLAL